MLEYSNYHLLFLQGIGKRRMKSRENAHLLGVMHCQIGHIWQFVDSFAKLC